VSKGERGREREKVFGNNIGGGEDYLIPINHNT
jgi:hypothetical protein